jgi:hypothetical protein
LFGHSPQQTRVVVEPSRHHESAFSTSCHILHSRCGGFSAAKTQSHLRARPGGFGQMRFDFIGRFRKDQGFPEPKSLHGSEQPFKK